MNRLFLVSSAVLVFLSSCVKEVRNNEELLSQPKEILITATVDDPLTRTTVNIEDKVGHYVWEEGETIAVVADNTEGVVYPFELKDGVAGTFGYTPAEGETVGDLVFAVTPQNALVVKDGVEPLVDGGDVIFNLSLSGMYDYGHSNAIMVAGAPVDNGDVKKFTFKHAAALYRVEYENVPVGTLGLKFVADGVNITGTFEFSSLENVEIRAQNVSASATNEAYVLLDNPMSESNQSLVFYIPVPTGSYTDVTVSLINSELEEIANTAKTFTAAAYSVKRGGLIRIPKVTLEEKTDPHVNDEGWFLVKDVTFLKEGDVIRLASSDNNVIAGPLGSNDYLSAISASFDKESEMISGVSEGFVNITLGRSSEAWTMSTSEGFYYSTKAKSIIVSDEVSGNWSISISEGGKATIKALEDDHILFNVSSPRFLNYTSSPTAAMVLPEIYKKYGNPADAALKEDQDLSFSPSTAYAMMSIDFEEPVLNGVTSSGAQTWSSSNTTVATVNNEGEVTLVAPGSTIIKVVVEGDEEFNSASAEYELTVEPAPTGTVWTLVTNASDLMDGMSILITSSGNEVNAMGEDKGNNRGVVPMSIVPNVGIAVKDKNPQVIVLEQKDDNWMLNVGDDQYLYAASSSSNYLKTGSKKTVADNGVFSIKIADGKATVKAQGNYTHDLLRYNSASSLFACYASGQSDIAIYRNPNQIVLSVESIAITTAPDKTEYAAGEVFDPTGMVVKATYSDGNEEEITDYTFSPDGALSTATTAITVSYKGKNATVNITVNKATPNLVVEPSSPITLLEGKTQQLTVSGTDGALSYSSSDASTVSVSNTGLLKAEAIGTATITINAAETDNYKAAATTVTVNVEAVGEDGDGSLEHPFTPAGVKAYIDNGGNGPVYVAGKVVSVSYDYGTTATFFISADGTDQGAQFEAYYLKYLGDANYTSGPKPKVGDDVVIYGQVMFYESGSVYETKKNEAYLYSLNGKTKVLSAPSLLTPEVDNAVRAITVKWNAVTGATKYDVSCGGQTVENVEGTSYIFTLEAYGTYDFSVIAKADDAFSSEPASSSATLTDPDSDPVTDTYSFTSKSWDDETNSWTSGKDGSQLLTGRGVQITTGATGANATTKNEFNGVSQVVVTYSTNAKDGAGSISVKVGSNTAHSLSVSKTGGTTDRTLSFDIDPSETGKITITATCTTNSIYVKSVSITHK